jgi:YVTN family beta-propeller protein
MSSASRSRASASKTGVLPRTCAVVLAASLGFSALNASFVSSASAAADGATSSDVAVEPARITELASDSEPLAVAIAPSGFVYVAEAGTDTVTRINPESGAVDARLVLPAGATPSSIAIGHDGLLYVANTSIDSVSRINPDTMLIIANIALPVGSIPSGLAVAQDGTVFVANSGTDSVSRIPPAAVVPAGVTDLAADAGPAALATGTDGSVYVANYDNNTVTVLAQGELPRTIDLPEGANPVAIAVAPDDTIYTANSGDDTVSVIDPESTTVSTTIPIGYSAEPRGIGVDDNGFVYVVGNQTDALYRINRGQNVVGSMTKLAANAEPQALALTSGGDIYTANAGSHSVTRVLGVTAPTAITLKTSKRVQKTTKKRQAKLTAKIFAGGLPTSVRFAYSPNKSLTRKAKTSPTLVVAPDQAQETVTITVKKLKRGKKYYYRVLASNDVVTTAGKVKVFRSN